MANAFTQESRDARLSLGLPGFIDKLRAPDSLHALVMRAKPLATSTGDFALKALLDEHLIACIVRGDYREVYSTLGTIFGVEVTGLPAPVTDGTFGAGRHGRDQ